MQILEPVAPSGGEDLLVGEEPLQARPRYLAVLLDGNESPEQGRVEFPDQAVARARHRAEKEHHASFLGHEFKLVWPFLVIVFRNVRQHGKQFMFRQGSPSEKGNQRRGDPGGG